MVGNVKLLGAGNIVAALYLIPRYPEIPAKRKEDKKVAKATKRQGIAALERSKAS